MKNWALAALVLGGAAVAYVVYKKKSSSSPTNTLASYTPPASQAPSTAQTLISSASQFGLAWLQAQTSGGTRNELTGPGSVLM